MIDLSAYQGIIFDMDGTLIDSMGSHLQAWQKLAKPMATHSITTTCTA